MRDSRSLFVDALKMEIGHPYIWGQLDCSGLIIKCLFKAGIILDDTTAQGLYNLYRNNTVERLQAPPGSLYFYGTGISNIEHVMAVCEHWNCSGIVLIGSRGGDHTTTTLEAAAERKAFVDAVWGDYWLDKFVVAVDPFV
jgi:hypothetical protein